MNKKYKRRYGKFPVLEPLLIILINVFAITIFGGYKTEKIVGTCFYVSIWLLYLMYAYKPFLELFYIQNSTIYKKKFLKETTIIIPDETVFIITFVKTGSFFPKEICLVNIVANEVDATIEKLNKYDMDCGRKIDFWSCKKGCIYDEWCIETRLKNTYVYSFVYNKETTQKLFNEFKKTVILPRSLKSKITIEENGFEVVVYEGR